KKSAACGMLRRELRQRQGRETPAPGRSVAPAPTATGAMPATPAPRVPRRGVHTWKLERAWNHRDDDFCRRRLQDIVTSRGVWHPWIHSMGMTLHGAGRMGMTTGRATVGGRRGTARYATRDVRQFCE